MTDYVAAELSKLTIAGKDIDLIYVSHIDNDHIGGVQRMLEMQVQWKAYEFQLSQGDAPREPKVPKTPKVKRLWHNAFSDIVESNIGDIEELLAASAPMLQSSVSSELLQLGYEYAQIATSVEQALRVSRLVKPEVLDIALNTLEQTPEYSGKLLIARNGQAPEQFGTLNITILCPTVAELEELRKGWNQWLDSAKNRDIARRIQSDYAASLTDWRGSVSPVGLFGWEGRPGYKDVTTPNVASLVLLVEEDGKRILLTGDNHPDMILQGLESMGLMPNGHIHLDVLKVQHHGSEHNISEAFSRAVSADHYVFCGDGSNTNPELSVVKQLFAARLGEDKERLALAPEARNRPFKFWFSTSMEYQSVDVKRMHMKRLEKWAREVAHLHPGAFEARFNTDSSMTIVL